MTDDLVKRLNQDFSANAREDIQHQMKVYEKERKEAAARIEKLEAALREIEYLDSPLVRGKPRRVEIYDIARAALGEKKDGNV